MIFQCSSCFQMGAESNTRRTKSNKNERKKNFQSLFFWWALYIVIIYPSINCDTYHFCFSLTVVHRYTGNEFRGYNHTIRLQQYSMSSVFLFEKYFQLAFLFRCMRIIYLPHGVFFLARKMNYLFLFHVNGGMSAALIQNQIQIDCCWASMNQRKTHEKYKQPNEQQHHRQENWTQSSQAKPSQK